MDSLVLLREVNLRLNQHNVQSQNMQEQFINKYMQDGVSELNHIMAEYAVDYNCSTNELQNEVKNSAEEDLYRIVK